MFLDFSRVPPSKSRVSTSATPQQPTSKSFHFIIQQSSHHSTVQSLRWWHKKTGQGTPQVDNRHHPIITSKVAPRSHKEIQNTVVCQIRILSEGTHNTCYCSAGLGVSSTVQSAGVLSDIQQRRKINCTHGRPTSLKQRAKPIIVSWFGGRKWKNKCYT
jgi:hypothetical protein